MMISKFKMNAQQRSKNKLMQTTTAVTAANQLESNSNKIA